METLLANSTILYCLGLIILPIVVIIGIICICTLLRKIYDTLTNINEQNTIIINNQDNIISLLSQNKNNV